MTRWMMLTTIVLLFAARSGTGQESNDEIYPQDESVPSEKCISHTRIRRTEVINDRNILFHMRGGQIYRNVLPRRCPGLDRHDTISYRPRTSQLCDLDAITILMQTGRGISRGVSCGLGKYYPVTEAEVEALKDEAERVRQLKLEEK